MGQERHRAAVGGAGYSPATYLFSGPRGCEERRPARILARSLNCAQGHNPVRGLRILRFVGANAPGSIDV